MRLYQVITTTIIPAKDAEEALEFINAHNVFPEDEEFNLVSDSQLKELVKEDEFSRIMRLAKSLIQADIGGERKIVEQIYTFAVNHDFTRKEIQEGILSWAEKLLDADDETKEEWLGV